MFLNKTQLMNREIIGNHAPIINVIGSLNNVLIEYLHTWLHHFIHGNGPLGWSTTLIIFKHDYW